MQLVTAYAPATVLVLLSTLMLGLALTTSTHQGAYAAVGITDALVAIAYTLAISRLNHTAR